MTGRETHGRALARQLLGWETALIPPPGDIVVAAAAVCQKFYQIVGPFIGLDGFRLLLARALVLATADFPFLETLRVGAVSDGIFLSGLNERTAQQAATEVEESMVAVLGGFVDLLATFIGADLALRMIHRRWPAVPRMPLGTGEEGGWDG